MELVMKNILKLSAVLFFLALISNATFAQDAGNVTKQQVRQANWVDANGDGICDNVGTAAQRQNQSKSKKMNKGVKKAAGQGLANGNMNGYGDGTGLRPQDGTGFGKKNASGTCDGTGNAGSGRKGSGRRGGK